MSSPSKVLSILSLFSQQRPVWQPEEICEVLDFTRATGYRYIKELVDFGLLKKVSARNYSLGPRIIELDYQLRGSDPVLLAADPVMQELSTKTGKEVVLTVLINRKQVIDTHRVYALNPGQTSVARSRGRQRPMFRAGAPKILLSWLPRHQQKQIYQSHAAEILAHSMGSTWDEFRTQLDQIRKSGFYMSWGELEPELGAAVVPVFNPDGDNVAALNLLDSPENIRNTDPVRIKALLEEVAWKIRQRQAYPALLTERPGASKALPGQKRDGPSY